MLGGVDKALRRHRWLLTALLVAAVTGARTVVAEGELVSLLDVDPAGERALLRFGPRGSRVDRAKFEKLKDAYVKARYSKHFRISEEELDWLSERVEVLRQAVQVICEERIAALELSAAA